MRREINKDALIQRFYFQTDPLPGIPVGVGIARTKSLAKVANRIAKKSDKAKGVLDLYESKYIDIALERTGIGDVWNIGRESAKKLAAANIKTALQLKYFSRRWIRKLLTVKGARTQLELNGIRCLPLELTPPRKKNITRSGSFGAPVTNYGEMYNAVFCSLMKAVEEMRSHNLSARSLPVFCGTNRFVAGCYTDSFTFKSACPSNNLFDVPQWKPSMKRGSNSILLFSVSKRLFLKRQIFAFLKISFPAYCNYKAQVSKNLTKNRNVKR